MTLGRCSTSAFLAFDGVPSAEVYPAAVVDLRHLDHYLIAGLNDIFDPVDTVVCERGDVHEALLAGQDFDERAEIHDVLHDAAIYFTDLDLGGDVLNHLLRLFHHLHVIGVKAHFAGVVDVDLDLGLVGNLPYSLPAGTDKGADLVGLDLYDLDSRRVRRYLRPGLRDDLIHFVEDVYSSFQGAFERFLYDVKGYALDLDVHLEGCYPVAGAGDFEIHITECVFYPEYVREDYCFFVLDNKPHCDAGYS